MEFIKKVLVLKQIEESFSCSNKRVSAILRLERENGVTDVFLSSVNFRACSVGEYRLFLFDGKSTYSFLLGARPSSFKKSTEYLPDFKKGLCAGIVVVKNDLPLVVAYSATEDFSASMTKFKKAVAERCLEEKELSTQKPLISDKNSCDCEVVSAPTLDLNESVKKLYDDEAVATENYYDLDQEISSKLEKLRSFCNDEPPFRNELPACECEVETQTRAEDGNRDKNETDACDSQKYSKARPYYDTVVKELKDLFFKFPKEEGLERLFPKSQWSKIFYSEGRYYVVGLIKENDAEKYICYGVPAVYSKTPPKELDGFCSFIPLSIFDLNGEGYWMMFQDAVTGKCIKPE